MDCPFTIGQKVVCVDADRRKNLGPYELRSSAWHLVRGEVYTVTGIEASAGIVRLHLLGCARTGEGLRDTGYGAMRFRPVTAKKSDISVFKAILENPKQPIPA